MILVSAAVLQRVSLQSVSKWALGGGVCYSCKEESTTGNMDIVEIIVTVGPLTLASLYSPSRIGGFCSQCF
jgi:hypothetical protein